MLSRNLRHTLRSPDAMLMAVAVPITILLMFAYVLGGAMNVGGSALHWFAENQPVTPVIETMRGLLMGTPIGDSALLAVLWCGGIALAGYLAANALFRRKTQH